MITGGELEWEMRHVTHSNEKAEKQSLQLVQALLCSALFLMTLCCLTARCCFYCTVKVNVTWFVAVALVATTVTL